MATPHAILLLCLVPAPQAPQAPSWHTEQVGGIAVHVLQVTDAPVQTVFTFLPTGLATDPADRAQFAHLAEHMLIRSTDPTRLQVGGIRLNGETTGEAMRLESVAPPDSWRPALVRHMRWLTARQFDPKVLEREKVRIAGEERATAPRGFNHKWAIAAWAQLLAGRDHAAVHGDVAAATVAQVAAYVRGRVRLSEARMMVTGPRAPAEVVAALREEWKAISAPAGAAEPQERTAPSASATPSKSGPQNGAPRHTAATWDLPAEIYAAWYPLPVDCSAAEAEVLATLLTTACFGARAFRDLPGRALASALSRGGRRYLMVSATPSRELDDAALHREIDAAAARLPGLAMMQSGGMLARLVDPVPDFAAQRRAVPNARSREMVEAQFGMQCGYAVIRLGVPLDRAAAEYRAVARARLVALAKTCTPANRHSARWRSREARQAPPHKVR
ncbi:MAG: insulinase family protein [Planctomycetes bacterium]|nr:insulinase family protein [Planctomycetota bacterium]MCB9868729.1 insulinase family protein [Planctomycetota bacterium]MCB9889901.1 insulinase family protein [Planctomycetota bacterium]